MKKYLQRYRGVCTTHEGGDFWRDSVHVVCIVVLDYETREEKSLSIECEQTWPTSPQTHDYSQVEEGYDSSLNCQRWESESVFDSWESAVPKIQKFTSLEFTKIHLRFNEIW